jgi:erythromycin esterase-like protein
VKMLQELLNKRLELATSQPDPPTSFTSSSSEDGSGGESGGGEAFLDAEMNARVVADAERYYRAMYKGDSTAWNLRDEHMYIVLSRLLKLRPGSKAVVWAHNSHLGDARGSSMGVRRGEVNLGQLCRQNFALNRWGEVSIIGCGTHTGTVAAADEWDAPMQIMLVNPSRADSYERVLHDVGIPSFLLDMRQAKGRDGLSLVDREMEPRLQRFIGVIYRPDTERYSHYIQSVLNRQYDAFVFFDKTQAVHPFERRQPKEPLAKGETYPFGL